MNPHLTLTLSPPIRWERRGNSHRTCFCGRMSVGRTPVQGFNARMFRGIITPAFAKATAGRPALSPRERVMSVRFRGLLAAVIDAPLHIFGLKLALALPAGRGMMSVRRSFYFRDDKIIF